MRKRDLLFSRMVWIFSMFLTLFPFCVKARVSAGSERTKAVIRANKDKCLRDDSQAISHEMQAQRELAVRVFGGAETTRALHSASDAGFDRFSAAQDAHCKLALRLHLDRKSTRLNSS